MPSACLKSTCCQRTSICPNVPGSIRKRRNGALKTDRRPAWLPEETGTLLDTIDVFDHSKIEQARYALAGDRRVMVFCEGVYRLYDIASRKKIFETTTTLLSTTLSPGGNYLARTSTGSEEVGTIEIYDVRNLVRAGMLRVELGEGETLRNAVFAPDGARLCCTTRDAVGKRRFRVYELAKPSLVTEQILAENDLAKISRALPWYRPPNHLGMLSSIQFTLDLRQLVIDNQVVMNLDVGALATPLIPGRGLPAAVRALYTGPLCPMPDGSFLAIVHDGTRISLRSIGQPNDSAQESGDSRQPAEPTINQTNYAVDVTLPPLHMFDRRSVSHHEVSATTAINWQVVPRTVATIAPLENASVQHGTIPLRDPGRTQVHDALFPANRWTIRAVCDGAGDTCRHFQASPAQCHTMRVPD